MPDDALFTRLTEILRPYCDRAVVVRDDDQQLYLEAPGEARVMLGAVMRKAKGVAFHYYPVYTDPALLDGASPQLLRRKNGKSCFTFTSVQDEAIGELQDLVQGSADAHL